MTRALVLALAALLTADAALATPSFLGAGEIGVGAFGVLDVPIAQDDAGLGPMAGVRARMGVTPILSGEASIAFLRSGDGETVSGGTLPAPDLISYSLNAVLRSGGVGFAFTFTGGLGLTTISYPGELTDQTGFSWNLGLGVELGVGPVLLDAGPRLLVIRTEDDASRKHLEVVTGVTWFFR